MQRARLGRSRAERRRSLTLFFYRVAAQPGEDETGVTPPDEAPLLDALLDGLVASQGKTAREGQRDTGN